MNGLMVELEDESAMEEDPKEEREGDLNMRPPRGDFKIGEGPEIDLVSVRNDPAPGSLWT